MSEGFTVSKSGAHMLSFLSVSRTVAIPLSLNTATSASSASAAASTTAFFTELAWSRATTSAVSIKLSSLFRRKYQKPLRARITTATDSSGAPAKQASACNVVTPYKLRLPLKQSPWQNATPVRSPLNEPGPTVTMTRFTSSRVAPTLAKRLSKLALRISPLADGSTISSYTESAHSAIAIPFREVSTKRS